MILRVMNEDYPQRKSNFKRGYSVFNFLAIQVNYDEHEHSYDDKQTLLSYS